MNTSRLRISLLMILGVLSSGLSAAPSPVAATFPSGFLTLSEIPNHPSSALTGIGRLRTDQGSYCTASLIDTRTSAEAPNNSPAYIITSQRCLNTDSLNNYRYRGGTQQSLPIQGTVYFKHFQNTLGRLNEHALKEITWQSDAGSNIAVIELKASLSQLIKEGIKPLKLANVAPLMGTDVITLGIASTRNLYATQCTQLDSVDIAHHPWVGINLLANQCADLTLGGRGGPVLNKATLELISLVVASNHGSKSSDKCLDGAPCELVDGMSRWRPDTHYAHPVSFLNHCFTQGKFAADTPECDLYQLPSVSIKPSDYPASRLLEKLSTQPLPEPDAFTLPVTISTPRYRYKYTHTAQECHSGAHYSTLLESKDATLTFTLNNRLGLHLICIVGIDPASASISSAQMKAATIIAIDRYSATPALPPNVKTGDLLLYDESYTALWEHNSPFFEHYETKFGPYTTTDCSNPEGYEPVMDMDFWLSELLLSEKIDATTYNSIKSGSQPTHRIMGLLHGKKVNRVFERQEQAMKLCTVVYNRENIRSEPRVDIFNPL